MNDDKEATGGAAADDIVFNPPSAINLETVSPPHLGGVVATPAVITPVVPIRKVPPKVAAPTPASAYSLSEEVGLRIDPATRSQQTGNNFSKILADSKLPERHDPVGAAKKTIPLTAPASPIGAMTASMPEFLRSQQAPHGSASPTAIPSKQNMSFPPAEVSAAIDVASIEGASSPVVSLHTMKGDLQSAVQQGNISTVRAAALEADKRTAKASLSRVVVPPRNPRRRGGGAFLIITTVIFFALGGATLYALYFTTLQKTPPHAQSSSLIFSEQQTALPLDGQRADTLKQALARAAATVGSGSGSILQIVPTITGTSTSQTRLATLAEFLVALHAQAPDDLLRALSDQFFFGIHSADVPSPIFIIPVTSYDRAFAGMLEWESSIDGQLSPPFKVVSPYLLAQSTSSLPALRTFQDAIMKNYDIRVLKDDDGTTALYYSFPNQNLLIIAGSLASFPEILSRLQAQRKL